jgi:sugar/nucleoside kinase (ribokinase family)
MFPAESVEVVDVTGAGDTFLAALTYQFLETQNIAAAIRFAIKASTITVQHFGVYAPTLEEICG